jgi:hypothetical protein
MSKAYEMLFAALTEHGSTSRDVRQTSSMWQCPGHPDNNPSLKIDDKDGRALVCCYAGCQTDDVMAALGLSVKDLFDNDLDSSSRSSLYGQLVRSYLYEVPNGDPWFWVDRYYPKSFRQRLPGVEPVRDLSDKQALSRLGLRVRTANGMQTREPVVYHAPKAWLAGYRGERTIWWLDGEKDVEAAEKDGHVATCAPGFAKWRPQYATALHSWGFKEVVMVVDQDKDKGDGTLGAGAQVANAARLGFRAVGMKVRIVAPAAGKDYSDHRAAGCGPDIDDFDTDVTVAVRPRGMSAALLVTKKFEPIEFVIDHILPTGLTIIAGSPKVGKALSVETPLLTTDGWTTMGEVQPGQKVFALDGTPTDVVAATDVMFDRPCFRVITRSGAELIADAEHQWQVHSRNKTRVMTTQELYDWKGERRWLLPVAEPLHTVNVDLPVDPWVLGYWLANGSRKQGVLSCHPDDREQVIQRVTAAGYQIGRVTPGSVSVHGLMVQLRDLGVLDDKHIPAIYRHAGTDQRRALLSGLCDGDSWCITQPNGTAMLELTQVRSVLIDQAAYLARSLGFKVHVHKGRATLNGVDMGPKWRMCLHASQQDAPVTFERRVKALPVRPVAQRSRRDAIVSVEPVYSVPVRCIQVAHPSGTYLAGPELTVTHNSWVTLDWCCAVGSGGRALGYLQALQGNALLVAREDSYRRLQSRLALIMGGDVDQVPADLEIVPADVDWVGGEEGIGHLTEWADEVPNPRLVVLDTLGKVEPELGESDRRGNAYTGNYSMMARYKNWADQRNIAVVAVHHDRKGGAGSKEKMGMEEDPFTKISGTRGLTGAADTLMFLETVRGSGAGDLHITGRDVPTMSLELHKTGPLWQAWDVPRGE